MANTRLTLNSSNVPNSSPQDFTTVFATPLHLDGYELAVESIGLSFSWFNISAALGNNLIGYGTSIGGALTTLTIPDGEYGLSDINTFLQTSINLAGGTGTNITLAANINTLKTNITLAGNYYLDLTQGTLWKMLGFNGPLQITTQGLTASPNEPNVTPVNMVLFHCSIVTGSYYNGITSDVIASYIPQVKPGSTISINPNKPFYLPIAFNSIQSIRCYITDNNNNILNLQNQPVTYELLVRKVSMTDKLLEKLVNNSGR